MEKNIQALLARRAEADSRLGWHELLVRRLARFAGSMGFIWLHLAIYGGWIIVNLGYVPGLAPDPALYFLTVIIPVEALFLSAFVLIEQNRMMSYAERRADLDLQISLLAEHEITHLVHMVSEIGKIVGATSAKQPEVEELKEKVDPEALLDVLERQSGEQ